MKKNLLTMLVLVGVLMLSGCNHYKCYEGTSIPSFTSVTGVEPTESNLYSGNPDFLYEATKDDVEAYFQAVKKCGFEFIPTGVQETEERDESRGVLLYANVAGREAVAVSYDFYRDEEIGDVYIVLYDYKEE